MFGPDLNNKFLLHLPCFHLKIHLWIVINQPLFHKRSIMPVRTTKRNKMTMKMKNKLYCHLSHELNMKHIEDLWHNNEDHLVAFILIDKFVYKLNKHFACLNHMCVFEDYRNGYAPNFLCFSQEKWRICQTPPSRFIGNWVDSLWE